MHPHRRNYLQSVLGAAAGFAAWIFTTLLSFAAVPGRLPADLFAAGIFGLLAGGAIAGGQEIREQRRFMPWALWGALLGMAAGLLGTAIHLPIDTAMRDSAPEWNRLLQWVAVTGLIGTFLGFRWLGLKPSRLAFSALGGCAGGLAGGIMIGFLSGSPDVSPAIAYILAGAGLGLGYSYHPPELHAAVLHFVSSSDGRTTYKLKSLVWNIDATIALLFGNSNEGTPTPAPGDVFIQLWDPTVAANHARVFYRQGQFVLSRHADIRSAAALTRYIVRAGERSVSREQSLQDGDEIRIGSTVFRIEMPREEY